MKTAQKRVSKADDLDNMDELKELNPDLVTVFGEGVYFEASDLGQKLKAQFPNAQIIGCSALGEISEDGVFEDSLVVTAASFNNSDFRTWSEEIKGLDDSEGCGQRLAEKMDKDGLSGIIVFGQGININGSALIDGIRAKVGDDVVITGGLAGDGAAFEKTFVIANEQVSGNHVAAMGVYGDNVQLGYGSQGGWEPFGPVRKVTKSEANVLFELDGKPALEVYKEYLGDHAKELPASGLLFPFALLNDNRDETGLIRTILGIDEEAGSLTLAGDMPMGGLVKLMHANNGNLVSGAEDAAAKTAETGKFEGDADSLSILVSCIGRKIVMGPDVDDEVEAVQDKLPGSMVTGFYSHGEISPLIKVHECKLHNQTMTITTLTEKKAS